MFPIIILIFDHQKVTEVEMSEKIFFPVKWVLLIDLYLMKFPALSYVIKFKKYSLVIMNSHSIIKIFYFTYFKFISESYICSANTK